MVIEKEIAWSKRNTMKLIFFCKMTVVEFQKIPIAWEDLYANFVPLKPWHSWLPDSGLKHSMGAFDQTNQV